MCPPWRCGDTIRKGLAAFANHAHHRPSEKSRGSRAWRKSSRLGNTGPRFRPNKPAVNSIDGRRRGRSTLLRTRPRRRLPATRPVALYRAVPPLSTRRPTLGRGPNWTPTARRLSSAEPIGTDRPAMTPRRWPIGWEADRHMWRGRRSDRFLTRPKRNKVCER